MKRNMDNLVWREVSFIRPFELLAVHELLTHLATLSVCGYLVWEVRGSSGQVRHLVGADKRSIREVEAVFGSHLNVQFAKLSKRRKPMLMAHRLKITRPTLSLRTNNTLSVTRAVLAVLAHTKSDEEIALQIILGSSRSPAPLPDKPSDPHATWLDMIRGTVKLASGDSKAAMHEKMDCHGFNAIVRIGASGDTARYQLRGLLSALKTLESVGVRLTSSSDKPLHLNACRVPWHLPRRFSIKELSSLFVVPIGEDQLPGVGGVHPVLLPPPEWLRTPSAAQARIFGMTSDNRSLPLSISPRDSLEHTILLGPTGAGKSTAMLNLVMADINAGRSVLLIDPKADLVNDVLRRIPEHRLDDVVVLDPSDSRPVGFNPLHVSPRQNSNLVADSVLAVLKEIFADSWGIRTQDILSGALMTLAKTKDATLIMLPALLTDEAFRRKVVSGLDDRIGLLPFWAGYEAMKVGERNQAIAPVLNKLRQFILRPELRNVLGQSQPEFSLSDLFDSRKIVLVPLNKGAIGAENARLLGSLMVGLTWTLALSRANLPAERRHIVSMFIDELQDYVALPTNLSDALAQARGMGVGITMAHQYRAQLSPEIRAGIDANTRNKIMFGLNANDARDMAMQAPELTSEDFMLLPRFGVYANLQSDGKATGWISGNTKPMPPMLREATEARAASQSRYGRDTDEVERDYLAMLGYEDLQDINRMTSLNVKDAEKEGGSHVIGRKKKIK
jgi:hypothetical protein